MGKHSVIAWVAAIYWLLATSLAGAAPLSPEAQRALTWLNAQVQADGSLASEAAAVAAPMQSRSETAFTLAALAVPSASLSNAIAVDTLDDTEFLARRIYALSVSGAGVSELVAVLKSRQNADGGFPARDGAQDFPAPSGVLDTAWGLLALTGANLGADAAAVAARDYLLAALDADGGMPGLSGDDAIQAAALALAGLADTPPGAELANRLGGMSAWLAASQAADGSWLGDAYLTGLVLYAIAPQAVDGAVRDKAWSFLAGRQAQDGSWQADPFLTAVALRALVQDAAIPNGPATRLTGKVVDARSGAPQAGATATLSPLAGPALTATSSADGVFSFETGLLPGEYGLTVSKAGYVPASLSSITVLDGQTGNAGVFALAQSATAGAVRGTVTDGVSGAPLAGVAIEMKIWGYGGPTILLNKTTDAAGNYEYEGVQLPEPFTGQSVLGYMTVRLDGYQTVTSTARVVYGSVTVFSPMLYPANVTAPSSVTISGKVVDGAGAPLAGVSISSYTSFPYGKTALDGSFSISSNPGVFDSVTFSLAGYQAYTQQYTPVAGSSIDLGTIVLSNRAVATSITGKVKNQITGIAIAGAEVRLNNSLTATTDSSGIYSFVNLSGQSFDLAVTASGYIDQYWALKAGEPSNVTRDFQLIPVSANTLNIGSLSVNPNPAGHNTEVTVTATISNPQTMAVNGVALLQLTNSQGTVIDSGSAYDASGTQPLGGFSLAAGQSLPVSFKWHSGRFAPGSYTAVVRIVAPQTMSKDRALGVGLAMANSGFGIVRGCELLGSVTPSPSVIRSGFETPVSLAATVQNSGNVALPNQSYRLSLINTADGFVAATKTAGALALPAGGIARLDFGSWVPSAQGTYRFEIAGEDGCTGAVSGLLNVGAPAQASFTLARPVVPPGTQTVAANIRLTDVRGLSGHVEDPLKPLLKQAVQRAVRYNDSLSANWTRNNQCYGCHVQAQTLVGGDFANRFAPDYDRAKREAVYRGIVDYRQSDGSFGGAIATSGLFDNGYMITGAAMGAWALAESGHVGAQDSVDTVFGALRYLNNHQELNGRWTDKYYDGSDTFIGWMDRRTNTPLGVRAIGLMKKFLRQHPNTYTQTALSTWVSLPDGPGRVQLRTDLDGNVLVATYGRTLERIAPDGSRTVLDPNNRGHLSVGADGSIYYLGAGYQLTRRSPNGTLTTIAAPVDYHSGIAVGPDGSVYYGAVGQSYPFNIIRRVTLSGQISDYVVNDPLFSGGAPYLAFGPDGELVASTGTYNTKLLRIWPDRRSEIVADFTGLSIIKDVQWRNNAWWVTTQRGVYRYDKDWRGGPVPNLEWTALAGGSKIGNFTGFTVIGEGRYAFTNGTTMLYRADPLPAETQIGLYDTMQDKAVDWLLSNPQEGRSSSFYAGMFMLGLTGVVDEITDLARKTRVQSEIQAYAAYLKANQLPNGGWSWMPTLAADPMTTAIAGYALDFLNPDINEPYIRKAVDFLLSAQQPDGSWISPSVAGQAPGRDNLTAQAPTSWVNIWLPRLLDRVSNAETSLTLELPANTLLKNPAIAPDVTQPGNSYGGVSYTWKFPGDLDNLSVDLGFELELHDMLAGETRAAVGAGNLTLSDSLSGISADIPIAVPSVSAPSGVAVAAVTDQNGYPAQTDAVVTATVSNQNMAAQDAVVNFEVVDALGVTVARLPSVSVSLPANGSASVSSVFNTGMTLAGSYTVRASATSASGAPLATGNGTFDIFAGAAKASIRVGGDKAVYLSDDAVRLTTRIGNLMSNDILNDLSIVTTFSAPDGTIVFSKTDMLAQLLPGAFKDYNYAVNLSSAPLGQYKAAALVKAGDGTPLASAQSLVQVVAAPSLGVQGSLNELPASVMIGQPVPLAGSITATAAVNGLPLTLAVIDPATSTVLQQWTETVASLAAGAAYQLTPRIWNAAGRDGDRLLLVLSAGVGGEYINLATRPLNLTPMQIVADMVTGSLTLSSSTPLSGDNLGISASIVNQYGTAIPGLAVRLSIVDPNAPGVALYSKNAALDLAGNQTQVVNGDWRVTAPAGSRLEARVAATLGTESIQLASQAFTVKTKAVVSATQALGSRVLVFFSCRPGWDEHDRYKYWERKSPCFGERRAFIGNLLNRLGIPHKIVVDEEEFAEAFRSHHYNTYWLLGAFTHFSGKLVNELKESVYRGDALILDSGLHSWRNWDLLETAGVRYRGRLNCIRQEITSLGKLFSRVNLATEGRPLMLEVNKGVVEALYQTNLVNSVEDDDDDRQGERDEGRNRASRARATVFPAVVSNNYGKGRVLLFNFDLLDTLMNTQDPNWASFVVEAFVYVKPQDASISTLGGGMPLDIRLSGREGDATVTVQLALPQGASLFDSKPEASLDGGKPTWTMTVNQSEPRIIQATLGGPTQPGEAHAVIQVSDTAGGSNIATLDAVYTVLDASQAAARAVTALRALNVANNERSYRDKAVRNIGDAESDLRRGRFEQAIRELTEAAEFAARIQNDDPAAARQAIDRWLRDVEIASQKQADKPNKPPVTFPPRNECKVRAGISGRDDERSLDIDFEPRVNDLGRSGDTFVAAEVELDDIPRWFFSNGNGWVLWQGGAIPHHGRGILQATTVRLLDRTDTSGFVGATIYIGYRVGTEDVKLYPAFTVR